MYQFRREIEKKEIAFPGVHKLLQKENWIDYQNQFGERLMATIEPDPNFKLTFEEYGAREEIEHLSFSMGDLFSNLHLQIA